MSTYTPIDNVPKIRDTLRAGFATNRSKDVRYRKTQLLQLAYLLQDNKQRLVDALQADLHRPAAETFLVEIGASIKEALIAYKRVDKWAKPEGVPFDLLTFAMRGRTLKEPKGTVLIIGPFNYPLWCLFVPLVGAIAAGCAVCIKPSEVVPSVQDLIAELIPQYLDPDLYQVVTAEVEGTTKLLELQWDHIMYTGNGSVGRLVATAAAKHLTPVSLELGGKSPVIVDDTADLKVTARRVLWGKVINAGQTCVAPDYVLVTEGRQDALVDALKEVHRDFYPQNSVAESPDFSRLAADRHFERVKKLLNATKGEIVLGGEMDASQKFIAPTIVKNVTFEDSLMEEELFGPVLPIIPIKDVQTAIDYINSKDRPLALYLFSTDDKLKKDILAKTISGMAMINDILMAAAVEGLGFGGTGAVNGAHNDKAGFDTFTHRRSTVDVPGWLDYIVKFRFPPYTKEKENLANKLSIPKIPYPRPGTQPPFGWEKWFTVFILVGGLATALTRKKGILGAGTNSGPA
ncbi:NAD-aldehyde dehydrogenase [Cantharellus anzutake]|uniref:NAD-aldehyde dehydrogenase n=1 Tax=Cantharellus anzutake TaxID=1750568 RepID=UPI001905FCF1|nr:NAD-aldehyde dehydrogenase [Cantharellus anzutake]KAF8332822.1 NAD-aldehyde dehydrogenase [Cantharellus anzutake]